MHHLTSIIFTNILVGIAIAYGAYLMGRKDGRRQGQHETFLVADRVIGKKDERITELEARLAKTAGLRARIAELEARDAKIADLVSQGYTAFDASGEPVFVEVPPTYLATKSEVSVKEASRMIFDLNAKVKDLEAQLDAAEQRASDLDGLVKYRGGRVVYCDNPEREVAGVYWFEFEDSLAKGQPAAVAAHIAPYDAQAGTYSALSNATLQQLGNAQSSVSAFGAVQDASLAAHLALPSPVVRSAEDRLISVYKQLLDLKADGCALYDAGLGDFTTNIRMAAETLAPVVAPILARKAA